MKKYYFIVNPKAGNGKCLKKWEAIEGSLQNQSIPYEVYFSKRPGHATELARNVVTNAGNGNISVIAVGGDGTAHEVLNGIGSGVPISFGFIPGGSGNDFSRGFSLPREPLAALNDLLETNTELTDTVDGGKLALKGSQERLFINNMGGGFDALVSKKANETSMKAVFNRFSLGRLVYVYILLKELFSYKPGTIELTIDGNRHIYEQTWFVTISNQPYYGGGMIISPSAKARDGMLDITVVTRLSRLKLLLVFMSVFWGKHIYFNEVHTFQGKEISISSTAEIDFHADGEYIGKANNGSATVLPGAFKILSNRRTLQE
ncbi:diacylglycerol/lipid kinase family protein [Bacillus sp. EB01]|uniref:diacylglycerol/lipid kinase family protein n=1 Tax=Bacillus sp. EB01 TaxID=1347086 RepID=UPI0005C6B37F|nr:diacylglycerol kinase family protein [Bacillus sp. EB01]